MTRAQMFRFDKFGPMDVLHADEVGVSQPGALEALISVRAAGVNPVDYKIRSGLYPVVGEDCLYTFPLTRRAYVCGKDAFGYALQIRRSRRAAVRWLIRLKRVVMRLLPSSCRARQ